MAGKGAEKRRAKRVRVDLTLPDSPPPIPVDAPPFFQLTHLSFWPQLARMLSSVDILAFRATCRFMRAIVDGSSKHVFFRNNAKKQFSSDVDMAFQRAIMFSILSACTWHTSSMINVIETYALTKTDIPEAALALLAKDPRFGGEENARLKAAVTRQAPWIAE